MNDVTRPVSTKFAGAIAPDLTAWALTAHDLRRRYGATTALDGVSLTVSAKTAAGAEVSLIPETLAATTLGDVQVGDRLNVEVDVIGKYVESLLGGYR